MTAEPRWDETVTEIASEVYRVLGEGNLESVYENAMAVEFRKRDNPYAIENNVEVLYKGESVGVGRLDFVIAGVPAVELKPVSKIAIGHEPQTRAYMQTADFEEALIVDSPRPSRTRCRSRRLPQGRGVTMGHPAEHALPCPMPSARSSPRLAGGPPSHFVSPGALDHPLERIARTTRCFTRCAENVIG